MNTKIVIGNDKIVVGKKFASGVVSAKDQIKINGQVVFQGKLEDGKPEVCMHAQKRFDIEIRELGGIAGGRAIGVSVFEGDRLIHQSIYDQQGKAVNSTDEAKQNTLVNACAAGGAILGITAIILLNINTGVVPGGAIGGAIGGGVGGGVGYGMGKLLTRGG